MNKLQKKGEENYYIMRAMQILYEDKLTNQKEKDKTLLAERRIITDIRERILSTNNDISNIKKTEPTAKKQTQK